MHGLLYIHEITSSACFKAQSNDTPPTVRLPNAQILVPKHHIQIKGTRAPWRGARFQGRGIVRIK